MYRASYEGSEVDTSYDIWKQKEPFVHCDLGGFKNFRDAKRAVIEKIDNDIAYLKRKRKEVCSMKKSEVFNPEKLK